MNILVTGGSGFLCHHLIPSLTARGHSVLAPRSAEVDLTRSPPDELADYIRRHGSVDAIIHAAAYYGGIGINMAEPAELLFRSSQMNLNVLEGAARGGVRHVLMVGSACAYPGGLDDDHREDQLMTGPLHSSVEGYGFTKVIALVGQRAYRKQYGIVGAHPILANLYGECDEYGDYRSHVAAALVKRFCEAVRLDLPELVCWGDGSPIREFVHAEDAARGIIACLDHPDVGPVNIGTGIGTSIRQLVDLIVEATGYRGKVRWDATKPGGTSRKVLSVDKARDALGWEARILLPDGIERTVRWFKRTYAGGFPKGQTAALSDDTQSLTPAGRR
jgi:GDP-L-fucose synthase